MLLSAVDKGTINQGDAVYHLDVGNARYPLHAAVHVGPSTPFDGQISPVSVCHIAGYRDRGVEDDTWNAGGKYSTHLVGQRSEDASPVEVKRVAFYAKVVREYHHSLVPTECGWEQGIIYHPTEKILDGIPMLLRASCSHFVEYCYKAAKLGIIDQSFTFDPMAPGRLYPTLQVHVFSTGRYGQQLPWDERFSRYPDCIG